MLLVQLHRHARIGEHAVALLQRPDRAHVMQLRRYAAKALEALHSPCGANRQINQIFHLSS